MSVRGDVYVERIKHQKGKNCKVKIITLSITTDLFRNYAFLVKLKYCSVLTDNIMAAPPEKVTKLSKGMCNI